MMFFVYTAALVSILAAFANATVLPRATKCQTVKSGYLDAFIGTGDGAADKTFDLNNKGQLTFGSGKAVQVEFQKCPELTSVSFKFKGRLVVTSSKQCLTITNPSSASGPYLVKAEKCTSNVKPSTAQTWGFGNDFGDVIFSTGTKDCGDGGAGLIVDDNGQPTLGSGKQAQLSCQGTNESFDIKKKKN